MIEGGSPRGQPFPYHLRRVAGVALCVSTAACAGMLAALLLVTEDAGIGYRQVIGSYSLTERNLGWSLLAFGSAIIAVTGITTWLIALYSSFRIAGPLYRLSRNLELGIEQWPAAPTSIRRGDQLQRESRALKDSVSAVRGHYDGLRRALREVDRSLQTGRSDDGSVRTAVAELLEIERRVRL